MILAAWADGWRRVIRAPAILAGVFAATLMATLPLAVVLRGRLESHLGSSLMADRAAEGVNWDWWQEFTAQATGVGATFTPRILGFASTLDSVSSVLDAQSEIAPVALAAGGYLLVWTFLSGGVLDRCARRRPTRAHGFFAAAGVFFWRFLRLGILAGIVYWLLFTYVHQQLFDAWYVRLTRDLDVERTAFLWRAAMYAVFGALLVAVNVLFDYAKVRLVVEDRRSAVGAVTAALGFITRNPGQVLGLYGLNGAAFVLVLGMWAGVVPGTTVSLWLSLAASQLYILARLAMKLQFMASQTALFQSRLAHAAYTAAPEATWPESPAAEAIRPVTYK